MMRAEVEDVLASSFFQMVDLVVQMNNQIDAAKRIGLTVKTINSENVGEWDAIVQADLYERSVWK